MKLTYELEKSLAYAKQTADIVKGRVAKETYDLLEDNIRRLETANINIAAFGETDAGKSALLNAIFGCDNNKPSECKFKVSAKPNTWSDEISCKNGYKWRIQDNMEITIYDTPGIGGDFAQHESIAYSIAEKCDIIVYVTAFEVAGNVQVTALRNFLKKYASRLIVVLNKADTKRKSEIEEIKEDLMSKFAKDGLKQEQIVCCAGHPVREDDEVQVGELISRILEIIGTEKLNLIDGKMKQDIEKVLKEYFKEIETEIEGAQRGNDTIYSEEKRIRWVRSNLIIHSSAVLAAGAAAGLAKVPGVQEATLTAITSGMTTALCANYRAMDKSIIIPLMTIASGAVLGKSAASWLWRFIPVAGEVIEGGTSLFLHELQGFIIMSYLEKGLLTKEKIKNAKFSGILKDAVKLRSDTNKMVRNMDPAQVAKLKKEAEEQLKEAKEESERAKKTTVKK